MSNQPKPRSFWDTLAISAEQTVSQGDNFEPSVGAGRKSRWPDPVSVADEVVNEMQPSTSVWSMSQGRTIWPNHGDWIPDSWRNNQAMDPSSLLPVEELTSNSFSSIWSPGSTSNNFGSTNNQPSIGGNSGSVWPSINTSDDNFATASIDNIGRALSHLDLEITDSEPHPGPSHQRSEVSPWSSGLTAGTGSINKAPSETNTAIDPDATFSAETVIDKLINNPQNWGHRSVDQNTPWEITPDDGAVYGMQQPISPSAACVLPTGQEIDVWPSEPPKGTGIWEDFYNLGRTWPNPSANPANSVQQNPSASSTVIQPAPSSAWGSSTNGGFGGRSNVGPIGSSFRRGGNGGGGGAGAASSIVGGSASLADAEVNNLLDFGTPGPSQGCSSLWQNTNSVHGETNGWLSGRTSTVGNSLFPGSAFDDGPESLMNSVIGSDGNSFSSAANAMTRYFTQLGYRREDVETCLLESSMDIDRCAALLRSRYRPVRNNAVAPLTVPIGASRRGLGSSTSAQVRGMNQRLMGVNGVPRPTGQASVSSTAQSSSSAAAAAAFSSLLGRPPPSLENGFVARAHSWSQQQQAAGGSGNNSPLLYLIELQKKRQDLQYQLQVLRSTPAFLSQPGAISCINDLTMALRNIENQIATAAAFVENGRGQPRFSASSSVLSGLSNGPVSPHTSFNRVGGNNGFRTSSSRHNSGSNGHSMDPSVSSTSGCNIINNANTSTAGWLFLSNIPASMPRQTVEKLLGPSLSSLHPLPSVSGAFSDYIARFPSREAALDTMVRLNPFQLKTTVLEEKVAFEYLVNALNPTIGVSGAGLAN